MSEINVGERYTSLFPFSEALSEEQRFLCFDVAKTNLFWLVEPRIDAEGIEAARGNPKALSIDEYMDTVTRRHLQGLPVPFVDYWMSVSKQGDCAIAEHWGAYKETMIRRAHEAQRRILNVEESGNVLRLNFRRACNG